MFSNITISLLFSLGASAWLYAKMQRQTGGNTKSALIVAGSTGGVLFLVTLLVLDTIF